MEKKSTKIAYFVALGVFIVLLVILGIQFKGKENPVFTGGAFYTTGDGVFLDLIDLASGGGNIAISGYGGGDGVYLYGDIDSDGGDVSIDGSGGEFGVYAYMPSGLQSGGGDIVVHGEGGSGDGSYLSGQIQSEAGPRTTS